MSGHHLSLVLSLNPETTPELTGPAMAVLQSHAWHANDAALSWPSVDLVQRETRLSLPTITRAHKLLVDHDWLARKRRHNTSTIYRLNVAKLERHRLPQTPKRDPFEGLLFAGETASDQGINHSEGSYQTASDQGINHSEGSYQSERLEPPITLRGATNQSEHLSSIEDSKKIHLSGGIDADGEEGGREGDSSLEEKPSAEALGVLGVVEWGEHRAPNKRETRELGRLLDAAAGEGRSWRLLRRHAVATVRQARPVREGGRAVSYLRNALSGDLLPVPDLANNAASAATSVPDVDTSTSGEDCGGEVMRQTEASATIRAIIAARKASKAPETALNRP